MNVKLSFQKQWKVPSTSTKKLCKQSKDLASEKTLAELTVTLKKIMQNNGISKLMNMERPDISAAVYCLLQHSQLRTSFVERSFQRCVNCEPRTET